MSVIPAIHSKPQIWQLTISYTYSLLCSSSSFGVFLVLSTWINLAYSLRLNTNYACFLVPFYSYIPPFFFHLSSHKIFFFSFIFISWRLITLQYCSGFCIHWNESAMDLHVFPIPIPPPTFLSSRSLWVFPVHQARALVSCIQRGLVICFTLDNIHVSMLFSWNIPPSPSPTESKNLFYTSVSLFLFCI